MRLMTLLKKKTKVKINQILRMILKMKKKKIKRNLTLKGIKSEVIKPNQVILVQVIKDERVKKVLL